MNNKPQQDETQNQPPAHKPNIFQVTFSVLAALFGVQSQKNRERDFKRGDASDYIGVYVFLVIGLVIGMIVVVNLVLSSAN